MQRTILGMLVLLLAGSVGLAIAIPKPADSISPSQQPLVHVKMDNRRLGALIAHIDAEFEGQPGNWRLMVQGIPAYVITDEQADRMRILVAAADATELGPDTLYRILQANFESALDARYAIAQDTVWSAFIHPLSTLDEDEFFSAVAQTYNAALTFGDTYSSGVFQFGGGDNRSDVFDEIIEKGTNI